MHTKNPWEDIKGVKHNSLCGKSQQSLMDCIEFHKLTVFTVDTVERLRYYLMCSVKKPVHLLSEDMVTVRPLYFTLQKLCPAVFTVKKFCATSLANLSKSHCI